MLFRSLQTLRHSIVAATVVLGSTGCYREVTGDPQYVLYDGEHPLTVSGIRPGQTADEARRLLGEPMTQTTVIGQRVWRWTQRSEIAVTLDAADRVIEVFGPTLSANGRTIVWSGASEAEVSQILGRGRVQEHRQPSGFVISVGSKLVGKTLAYHDRGVRIEVTLTEDSVRHVRVTAEPDGAARQ